MDSKTSIEVKLFHAWVRMKAARRELLDTDRRVIWTWKRMLERTRKETTQCREQK